MNVSTTGNKVVVLLGGNFYKAGYHCYGVKRSNSSKCSLFESTKTCIIAQPLLDI